MRPRLDRQDLPRNVYFRHGAYYLVRNKRWQRLGTDLEAIPQQIADLPKREPLEQMAILKFAYKLIGKSRQNAKGRAFSLTKEDISLMLNRAGWRCEVSNTPFTLEQVGPHKQRPYAPSIDRIDCSLGYEPSNCRIVCVAVNIAMNGWGKAVLLKIARNMLSIGQV